MHKMIEKFVKDEFMTEAEGKYIEEALDRKESIIVSGHRSAGTRPFMATLMAIAKSKHSAAQVKGFDDLEKEGDYLLIAGIPDIDFEKLIGEAMAKEDTAMISIKEPDHPYSIMKLLRQGFKANGNTDKVYQVIECEKENDVPFVQKITEMKLNEKGKVQKEDFKG